MRSKTKIYTKFTKSIKSQLFVNQNHPNNSLDQEMQVKFKRIIQVPFQWPNFKIKWKNTSAVPKWA